MEKLYVITRKDLRFGSQSCQAAHAIIAFHHEHPELANKWYKESNTIVMLVIDDEKKLLDFLIKAKENNIKVSEFKEPDFNNQLTAIVLEPSEQSGLLCKGLKLMGT